MYKPVLDKKRLQNTTLLPTELAVILGGLLGDGSLKIHPGYKNARYSFRHSIKQEGYARAKAEILRGLTTEKFLFVQKPDGWSQTEKIRFCTGALESLTLVHNVTHKKNQKKVKRSWLNHLSEQSLAIWWFDDGSVIAGARKGCIATDSFSLGEQKILAAWLQKVWGVRVKIHPVKNKKGKQFAQTYRLYLPTSSLKVFLTLVLPWVPTKEVLSKVFIRYKDKTLQQRWISHVKAHLPLCLWADFKDLVEKMI